MKERSAKEAKIRSRGEGTDISRWLLLHTMGCSETFEYRRTELAELAGKKNSDISDQEVADSFYFEATSPEGVYRRYLEVAQICP
jgi:hypothetical protein